MARDLFAWLDKYRIPNTLRRIDRLERRMSRVDDVLVELDAATNAVARELEQLRDEVSKLDAGTADKITPLVERLRSLAVDPTDPVPTL